MKRLVLLLLAIGFMGSAAASAGPMSTTSSSMRCGNDIVSIGDPGFLVTQRCGQPVARQNIGYSLDAKKQRDLIIEEWVFGPNGGYYYFVTLIGGRVTEIKSERQ
jgi:hypothetical protein